MSGPTSENAPKGPLRRRHSAGSGKPRASRCPPTGPRSSSTRPSEAPWAALSPPSLYATGTKDLTGLWRLKPGHKTPERIAALPANSLPNGLAFDRRSNAFYITDSVLGRVWSVPAHGGRATAWSTAPELAPHGFLGANGARVHGDALWVTNLDQGTVVRIPIGTDHRAGKPAIQAAGLQGIDDFAFTGRGNEILAALNKPNKIVHITDDGKNTTVLNASDGLQNPTSVAVRGKDVYVPSAAYATATDPNLLHARLVRHGH